MKKYLVDAVAAQDHRLLPDLYLDIVGMEFDLEQVRSLLNRRVATLSDQELEEYMTLTRAIDTAADEAERTLTRSKGKNHSRRVYFQTQTREALQRARTKVNRKKEQKEPPA